ncbi:hypothetical protein [endosymbiont of Ridgeia piscesae]|jgi:hypothetical protein|uniref:Uncharacterized protein n=1 Tax=endosymbiont of Ridgeia piscesae TaxID=54398 RepID=A0A0T5YZP6_9GAMM|nr:hypothetical protein [endosymbiont of Ridgeia piscesae]KRT56120.1 hypothetical protein Ga0074115_13170 [endosymbiont of Ridgeia piscesae]KRT57714.1 hypothetical protein Ga0076813_12103 [endosymbiont of Ridgeia piscesae]
MQNANYYESKAPQPNRWSGGVVEESRLYLSEEGEMDDCLRYGRCLQEQLTQNDFPFNWWEFY